MFLDLALIGFGHVGRRFARLLAERGGMLLAEQGVTVRIVGISTNRHGHAWAVEGVDVPAALSRVEAGRRLSDDEHEWLTTPAIIDLMRGVSTGLRVVVETTTLDIAAGQPAIAYIQQAFAAGCHVVTANKGPAAFAYRGLRDEARAAGVSFLFEGAVMDGIPIFNLVRETLPGVEVLGFRGVVNSTTNHILSALEDGEAFDPALARMQDAGIAEADPSLDIDGWDGAAKVAALANVLMDARITPLDVRREGIGPWSADAALRAIEAGRRLRLLAAAARREDGSVEASVGPVELQAGDLLANLRGQANALVLRTDLLGEIAVCQLTGGLIQTAYALLADLVTICRRHAPLPAGAPRRIP
jgi:homoserine dehydrogenase